MSDVFMSPSATRPATTPRVTNTAPGARRRGDKKQWSFESVTPCNFKEMHIWAVQVLEGHHEEETGQWIAATKTSTRVVYMKMNDNGTLENVFPFVGSAGSD